jgi:16S rRNA processing protein RimM
MIVRRSAMKRSARRPAAADSPQPEGAEQTYEDTPGATAVQPPPSVEPVAPVTQPGAPLFLAVGFLRRPHGVKGEILMDVLTDFPERLKKGTLLYVGDEHRPLRIHSLRPHAQGMIVAFDGFRDPEQAGQLRNQLAQVRADDRPPLPEGEYYQHQLLGLSVVSDEGQVLGRLASILETGANDVYVVRSPLGKEILLPAIPDVIQEIDLAKGEIRVHLLPGLIPE